MSRQTRCIAMVLAAWGALAAQVPCPGRAAEGVVLTLRETAGVARQGEPVTTGVPLPKGALLDAGHARLLLDGKEVPAQFRAAGLWRPGKSIRWLLVDTRADMPAGARRACVLEYGPDVKPSARPARPVRIQTTDDAFVVATGAATFLVNRKVFSLFDEVRLADGKLVVGAGAGAAARPAARVTGLGTMVTRPIPRPSNRGRSYLIYVRPSPKAKRQDYVLRFTSEREYEVATQAGQRVGRGAYRKDFTSTDGAIAIPADAWLNYAYAKKGDAFVFRVLPAGSEAASEHVWESVVLEAGPLRSVIRVKGCFGPAQAPALEFTAWYHFHAGSARVKLAFTLENNNHGGRTETGNAHNADIGGVNCVFFDGMGLTLPLTGGRAGRVLAGGSADAAPVAGTGDDALEVYQDSNGGASWARYRNAKFHPRPNSYVSFRGYRLLRGGKTIGGGERALGWLDVTGPAGGVTASVRDFWQNFPKALGAGAEGLRIDLFPPRYAGDFPLRSGEHKTHEILLAFHAGGAADDGNRALAVAFSNPLRLTATPRWYARTRALGDLHPYDPATRGAYEVRNLSAIGVYGEGVRPGPSILSRREENDLYGWMDYGDVSMDFEAPSGQWGMKYDMDYHMAQQFARTLRPQWWKLFVAADRHTADIDIHHQPHYPGLHFVKGGVWAHSTHDEPGHKNPHRNYNQFTKDLCFGARGTATLHYFTGNWKAHDACLEIAENARAEYMSPRKDPGPQARNNRMGWRGDACTLNRLLAGYLLSGDPRLLRHAQWQVKSCAFDGRPAKHGPISLWSSVFYMMALSRYVEMFPRDTDARSYLLAHVETLRKAIHPKTCIYYTITPKPDGTVTGKGTCSHYNIMAADALAVAYRLTGEDKYIQAARKCFAYGVKNACWQGGPPTYQQVHSANGAMHGNVFMVVDAALRAKER